MFPAKPLGHKSYGSIGHLPGSRQGRDDVGVPPGMARICTERARDRHDLIIVQEKLDGSNASVANIEGRLVPLTRSGHEAIASKYEQHRLFAQWVFERMELFAFLAPGERLCGEWLAQAHGTRYQLAHEPFVAFDIMHEGHVRAPFAEFTERAAALVRPTVLSTGGPCSIDRALDLLGTFGHHGALDPAEGAVWRVERRGCLDFLAKFVRPDKIDGCYLPEIEGSLATEPIWNWRPPRR